MGGQKSSLFVLLIAYALSGTEEQQEMEEDEDD